MIDDLASALEAIGLGVAAGMTATALMYAAMGHDWIGSAIAAVIALLIGLAGMAWKRS